jgi:hypothetical protein
MLSLYSNKNIRNRLNRLECPWGVLVVSRALLALGWYATPAKRLAKRHCPQLKLGAYVGDCVRLSVPWRCGITLFTECLVPIDFSPSKPLVLDARLRSIAMDNCYSLLKLTSLLPFSCRNLIATYCLKGIV